MTDSSRAKRAERLLKRFDLKMSDITGSNRPGRTPKTANGDATPGSKRKAGQSSDALETPTKRRGGAKGVKKEEDSQSGSSGARRKNVVKEAGMSLELFRLYST